MWFRRTITNFNCYIILLNELTCQEKKRKKDSAVILGTKNQYLTCKISWIFYLEAIEPWVSLLTSLGLHFLFCKGEVSGKLIYRSS